MSTQNNETRIFRAPGRVNLIGEHTDYNDGFVMPVALEFCTYVAVAPRSDRILHVHSENFNETITLDLDQLRRPKKPHWSNYVAGVAAVLAPRAGGLRGANLAVRGDLPVGA